LGGRAIWLEIHGFWVIFGSLKIAIPVFVHLRRLSVALLQNLPKSRAKSGRARLAYAPRAFFQIFIKATLNRRFAGLVWGHLMRRGSRLRSPLQT
jgi:hypothetical protein